MKLLSLLLLVGLTVLLAGCQVTISGRTYDCDVDGQHVLICNEVAPNPNMHYGPTLPH